MKASKVLSGPPRSVTGDGDLVLTGNTEQLCRQGALAWKAGVAPFQLLYPRAGSKPLEKALSSDG